MAETESIPQIKTSPAPFSTWIAVVLLFALFGIIVLAVIGPWPRGSDYEQTRAKKRLENLKTSREDADKALNSYAWVDKNKGVVRIPISRAMELTVGQLAQQKPAPAGPIATPQPAATAAAASPSPAGSPKAGTAQPAASSSPAAAASPSAVPQSGSSPLPQTAVSPSPAGHQASSPSPSSPAPTNTP